MIIPEYGVMLDAGTALYRAARFIQTRELDIFLTHAHLDHVVGLTYLLGLMPVCGLGRVRVHGQPEKLDAIERHLFAEPLFPIMPQCEFRPLESEVKLAGGGVLSYFPVCHPGGAVGFRLDWPGHALAYVTDTTAKPDAAYLSKIRGVDLLVHECHFPDALASRTEPTGHSCTTPVAQLAKTAGAKHLVLVHIDPRGDENDPVGIATARAIFPRTELGRDLMELEF